MEKTPLSIVNKNGIYAVDSQTSLIAVMLYTVDENNLLDTIGILKEENSHFHNNEFNTIIIDSVDSSDKALLSKAKLKVSDETGLDIIDNSKWIYLGEVHSSKLFTTSIYCFGANVTGLNLSKTDTKITFEPLNKIQSIPDAILHSCFLKLFTKLHKNELINHE